MLSLSPLELTHHVVMWSTHSPQDGSMERVWGTLDLQDMAEPSSLPVSIRSPHSPWCTPPVFSLLSIPPTGKDLWPWNIFYTACSALSFKTYHRANSDLRFPTFVASRSCTPGYALLAYPLLIYFKSYTVDLPWHSTKGEPATILNIFPCIWVFILKHLPALYQIRSCWRRAHPHLSVHTQGLCLWRKKTLLNQMRLWFLTNNCIKVW